MLAGAAVLWGCGGAAAPSDGSDAVRAYADRARAAGAETQAEVLDDGVVTDAELTAAIYASRDCIEAAGLETTVTRTFDGSLSISAAHGSHTAQEASQILDDCQWSESMYVEQAAALAPRGDDAGLTARLIDCLQGQGIDVTQLADAAGLDDPTALAWYDLARALGLSIADPAMLTCTGGTEIG